MTTPEARHEEAANIVEITLRNWPYKSTIQGRLRYIAIAQTEALLEAEDMLDELLIEIGNLLAGCAPTYAIHREAEAILKKGRP